LAAGFIVLVSSLILKCHSSMMTNMNKVFHVSKTFAEAEQWDIQQYRLMSSEQRLAAVEFLREQCWIAAGMKERPRIQKTGRIVEARPKRKGDAL
jgi:hypothetical protein